MNAGELRWHVIVRGVSAKTAGREALHRFVARQQRSLRQGYLEHRCQPRSRIVVAEVANNTGTPVERISLRGAREAGLRRMQRCSPALIAWSKR
jgi:hypothetical protein